MRRNLDVRELGDLLDRPLNAVLGLHRQDGSILLTPVWHLFKQGSFYFQVPGGDRKIAMLERDPRCSILVGENEHPYRAIEARGQARMSTDDYPELGPEIVRRYVEAYDPGANGRAHRADRHPSVGLRGCCLRLTRGVRSQISARA